MSQSTKCCHIGRILREFLTHISLRKKKKDFFPPPVWRFLNTGCGWRKIFHVVLFHQIKNLTCSSSPLLSTGSVAHSALFSIWVWISWMRFNFSKTSSRRKIMSLISILIKYKNKDGELAHVSWIDVSYSKNTWDTRKKRKRNILKTRETRGKKKEKKIVYQEVFSNILKST